MKNNVWVLTSSDEESQLRLLGVYATLEAAQNCPCVQGFKWELSNYGDFEAVARIPRELLWPGDTRADYVLKYRVEQIDVEG